MPSKARQGTVPPTDRTRNVDKEEGELIDEEEDVQQQIVLLRQEIQELRAQSRTPSERGTSRRRPASVEHTEGNLRALPPRLRPIPVFTGKSLREHRDHIQGAITYFEALGEYQERTRIAVAANSLQGDALDDWFRLVNRPTTWAGYEASTRSSVQSQEARMGNALLAVKLARQRPGQSVREFAHYLQDQWDDIPTELTNELTQAWDLVNGLQSQLRREILREERAIRTRAQVITTAQRIEELETLRMPERRRSGGESTPKNVVGERTCYGCGKIGHVRKDCPEKAKAQ